MWGGAPSPTPAIEGPHPHLLHECLDLVLQVLGQLWASPAWSRGQEAETVDGAELPLHFPARLEQPIHREGRVSQRKGPGRACGPPAPALMTDPPRTGPHPHVDTADEALPYPQ